MADADYLYVSVERARAVLGLSDTSADALLQLAIEAASRRIDAYCDRRFWTPTLPEERLFDTSGGGVLEFDVDLHALDEVVNGDGTVVDPADYWLLPANTRPKWGIRLKPTSGVMWELDPDGNAEQAVSVSGWWGYSASPPPAVASVALRLAVYYHQRRAQSGVQSVSIGDYSVSYGSTGGDGLGDIPAGLAVDLDPFRRRVLA